jgi:hypothetical protein
MIYIHKDMLAADYLEELLAFSKAIGITVQDPAAVTIKLTGPRMIEMALKRGALPVKASQLLATAKAMKTYGRENINPEERLIPKNLPVLNGRTGQVEMV